MGELTPSLRRVTVTVAARRPAGGCRFVSDNSVQNNRAKKKVGPNRANHPSILHNSDSHPDSESVALPRGRRRHWLYRDLSFYYSPKNQERKSAGPAGARPSGALSPGPRPGPPGSNRSQERYATKFSCVLDYLGLRIVSAPIGHSITSISTMASDARTV